jgi:EmrB/QacA subfamily drug resistance transporter
MSDPREPEAPAAGAPRAIGELRVVGGAHTGKMFAVRDGAVLGREAPADVVLADTTQEISRRHARISVEDGRTMIEDLGSTNGTRLNGKSLTGKSVLGAGDRIQIGSATLEYTPAPVADPQVTRPRQVESVPPEDFEATRARPIVPVPPEDFEATRARPIVPVPPEGFEATRARPIVPAAAAADGTLRIVAGPGEGREAGVHGNATIGREPECDLQVLDSEVSRRHAKITIRDGSAVIDDLNSANGTYVNGERIVSQYRLAPGDQIEIGEATIELSSPVLAGTARHAVPSEVTGVRDVIAQPAKLLTGDSSSRKWWTLAAVCTTTFMLLLDTTIVSVALPTISRSLKPSFSALQWVVDAYSLALAATLLTAGSMADIFGRKRVLMIGQVIFVLGSIGCGVAQSATWLDLTRGLQGIGAAMMAACALALIVQEFPAGQRGVAFGIYGGVNSLSVAIGPLLGGLLTQTIGWQAIFFINVPVGIAALYVIRTKLVNLPGPPTSIDWGGLVTFSSALVLITYGVISGNKYGWGSGREVAVFAAGVVLLLAFGAIELRRRQPMFDMRLFRKPTFNGVSLVGLTLSGSLIATIFFLTTWLQSVKGYTPIETGLRLLPLTLLALVVAPIAGRFVGKIPARFPLGFGMLLISIALLLMHQIDASSEWTVLLPGLILGGIAMGAVMPQLGATAVSIVPPWRSGMAGGVNQTFRQFGSTAGVAVLGALLQHEVATKATTQLAHTALAARAASVASAVTVGGTPLLLEASPPPVRPLIQHVAETSYASGLSTVFLTAAIFALVGAVAGLTLIRRKDVYRPGSEVPPGPPGGAGPGRPGGVGATGAPPAGAAAGAGAAGAGAGAGVGAGAPGPPG